MRVLLTGATGFIGRALSLRLLGEGHQLTALVRNPVKARALLGAEPDLVAHDATATELAILVSRHDAVINLAGSPVAESRWTDAVRTEILASRVETTTRLVNAMAAAERRPEVFISASAIGFYGSNRDEQLAVDAAPGRDFLANVCQAWEAAAQPAADLGTRLVVLRIGVVLGPQGGALAKLEPQFRRGLGATIGSGDQILSWIHIDDVIEVIQTALGRNDLNGPINLTGPTPVTNAEFAETLSDTLGVGNRLKIPGQGVRVMLGQRAALVLGSINAPPSRLLELGYQFRFPTLRSALDDLTSSDGLSVGTAHDAPEVPYLQKRGARFLLTATTTIPAARPQVFDFFSKAENLGAITPPHMGFEIIEKPDEISEGILIDYRIRLGPLPMKWRTQIDVWEPNQRFVDAQLRGPYKSWWHEHKFEDHGSETVMTDRVFYSPPLGPLGYLANAVVIKSMLTEIFSFRRYAIRWRFPASDAHLSS